jgi:two-component system sensor histidine kinase KdpD
LVVRHEATDLTDAVAAAAHDLKAELAQHKLILDVPSALPLVDADPRMLHHIMINLLGNAAKFAPAQSRITVSARRLPDKVTLSVLDEGPGLPHGHERDLFERFTQVEGDDMSGGTGLGLAIVKGFADAMGLSVQAENRGEGGAAFTIVWPAAIVRQSSTGSLAK